MATMPVTHTLSDFMEFDHVIEVHADGTVTDGPAGIYGPDLMHVEFERHPLDIENVGPQGWDILRGFSGQYGYAGGVMHASEQIGGGLETFILSHPGLYVACVVNCWGEPECDGHESLRGDSMGATVYCDNTCGSVEDDPEPAGWAVAFRHI